MTRDPKNPTPSAAKFGARAALDVIIVAVAVLAVAAASALIGCGGPHGDQVSTSQGSGTSDVVVVPAKGLPASAEVASVGMDPASGSHGIALGDSLPPDVIATVEDSLARPGDVV